MASHIPSEVADPTNRRELEDARTAETKRRSSFESFEVTQSRGITPERDQQEAL